jgi:uncharacterized phage infection (PIP) family protein YhgE
MKGGRQKKEAQSRAVVEKAKAAAAARQFSTSAVDEAAAEVAAAEGAATEAEAEARPAPPAKAARPIPPAKAAPAPPPEPTSRQKTNEQAKEKELFKTLEDHVKKLSDQLKQSEREKQQLKAEQNATTRGRRVSQEQKPTKTNAQRRNDRVCVETNHKDHNILSFDAVRKPGCISPAGYPPITAQLV